MGDARTGQRFWQLELRDDLSIPVGLFHVPCEPWARGKADASQIAPCKSQTNMPLKAFLESRQGGRARAAPARCRAASEACRQTTKQVKAITSCLCKHQKMLHTTEKKGGPIPCLNTDLRPLDRLLPSFSLVSASPVQNTRISFYVLMGCPGSF